VDGLRLAGILHLPDRSPRALVVGTHGLMADKNSPKQIALARRLTSIQMAYFRFDHRGCGESDGVFDEQTTLENRRSDLIGAVKTAREMVGNEPPVGLFGSSLGGTVCLSASPKIAPFAVVTLAAPVRSSSVQLPSDSPESLKNEISAKRLTFNICAILQSVHHVMVIHGGADRTVPVENANTIYQTANHPKEKVIFDQGDHRISDPSLQKRFVETAVRWFAACYREQFG
jgi:alpha-beta hydrolase superfamily lysophospholipase